MAVTPPPVGALSLTETWPLWLLLLVPAMAVAVRYTLTDRPAGKRVAAFALRALAVVLLVLGLCRPTVERAVDRVHAVFAVDVSASVDLEAASAALDEVDTAIMTLQSGDTHTLLALGGEVRRFETTDGLREAIEAWRSGAGGDRFRGATDLDAALGTLRLTLPDDAAARVVLFTDARPTGGDPVPALAALTDAGISVTLRTLPGLQRPEVSVAALGTSTGFAHEGELVRFTAEVLSNRDGPARVRLVHRGVIVAEREASLRAGVTERVVFDLPMVTPGRTVWTAQVAPAVSNAGSPAGDPEAIGDFFAVNNQVSSTVHVRSGRPRVLVLHEQPRQMRGFANAMERQDLAVEVRPAEGVPTSLERWLAFDAVVLSDIAATSFTPGQLETLKRYVADFGGGLAMLGSDNSFGLGGYYRTPVEDVLPLSSRFEQEKEKPSMAMALVIDKSGSMQGLPIALARQAAKAAVELLGPRDQIGVVGFDGQAFVAVPMQPAADRGSVQAAIDSIGAGGGTFMYAGMDAARQMLEGTAARIKHMIVLGDGMSQPADHLGLAQQLTDLGVTISTVALGPGSDQALMARIAEVGRGRYYLTMDPGNVPQIFTRETMQASRSAVKEDLFAAVRVGDHPLLAGYENAALPFTLGYVMTRARPTAQVLLATDTGDPLLAVNPFGLGQGLAFTGDLTPKWGGEWLAWPGFGKFWAQALRALVRRPNADPLQVTTSAEARTLRVEVVEPDALRHTGLTPPTPTAWRAETVDGTGRTRQIPVRAVGVGRYTLEAPLGDAERLTLRLHDPATSRLRVVQHDRPYPAEYVLAANTEASLLALPRFTPLTLRADRASAATALTVTPWLLLAAIVCLIAGVALRRV
ncbi:MAG: VWA domain-containing protein [Planctomycetota bacterium]